MAERLHSARVGRSPPPVVSELRYHANVQSDLDEEWIRDDRQGPVSSCDRPAIDGGRTSNHSSALVVPAAPVLASDPGMRGGPAGAGDHLAGLTDSQQAFFDQSWIQFEEADGAFHD